MQLSITINKMSSGKVVLAKRLPLEKNSLHKILLTCTRARGLTPLLLHEVFTTNHFRLVYPLLFLAWGFEGQIFIYPLICLGHPRTSLTRVGYTWLFYHGSVPSYSRFSYPFIKSHFGSPYLSYMDLSSNNF
jgi:hypothetical protein